jgi:hypothetical protein
MTLTGRRRQAWVRWHAYLCRVWADDCAGFAGTEWAWWRHCRANHLPAGAGFDF